ncbi:hypothetical protein BP6252_00660 [Coleophoma cylindrospora]|uniref:BOD1/SHG1 domain-containing protein n=1 Tax=Coleophoma cylindrospora TaxID=1849047 RepID=A0A3D8SS89_9HELO|nr:hypothetical protein BP6252_00660 [Coleophoma cylindrospora]
MAFATPYVKDGTATDGPARKKLKTSDLPIASATRAAIEGLAHTFKKKGGYDSIKKQVWANLQSGDFEKEFTHSLLEVAKDELEKNPTQLLKFDQGRAVALLAGAVDRAGVYQTAETRIDALIDAHVQEVEKGIRALRREDIGEEAARAEESRGGKTDEQYAAEYAAKRAAREEAREKEREEERLALEEKKKAEKARRREEEKRLELEHEKRRQEREARRKADEEARARERERERERDRERERERERDRERGRDRDRARERDRDRDDRPRERDRERDRERERDKERDRSDRLHRDDDTPSHKEPPKDNKKSKTEAELSKEESERLTRLALAELTKESKPISQSHSHMELEIDRSLAPPPRKTMPASAINPISRNSPSAKPTETKKTDTHIKEETDFKPPSVTEVEVVIGSLPEGLVAEVVDDVTAEIGMSEIGILSAPDVIVEIVMIDVAVIAEIETIDVVETVEKEMTVVPEIAPALAPATVVEAIDLAVGVASVFEIETEFESRPLLACYHLVLQKWTLGKRLTLSNEKKKLKHILQHRKKLVRRGYLYRGGQIEHPGEMLLQLLDDREVKHWLAQARRGSARFLVIETGTGIGTGTGTLIEVLELHEVAADHVRHDYDVGAGRREARVLSISIVMCRGLRLLDGIV